MGTPSSRVRALASEAHVDLDEALVSLWDAGLDYIDEPKDLIPARDLKRARVALGLVPDKREFTVAYWVEVSGLDRASFTARMEEVGVHVSANARRIPKNSLRRLRQVFGAPGLVPASSTTNSKREARGTGQQALPPFEWGLVGATPLRTYLSEDELEAIHTALERDYERTSDPIVPAGVRDPGLLSSAAHRPQTSFGGELKYPTAEMAAAALFHSVVMNHAFHNGNKRTGLVAMLAFLDKHDLVITSTENELFRFTLKVAQHGLVPLGADAFADREVIAVAEWVRANSRRVERGERPMKWIRLKQKLRDYGCETEPAGGVGNRLNIRRELVEPRLRGFSKRRRLLRTQVAWAGDGTEADRNTVHKIRKDLELDDLHDCDSATFYEGAEIDAYIIEYRRILDRLAKL